jgi:hypothetical protein
MLSGPVNLATGMHGLIVSRPRDPSEPQLLSDLGNGEVPLRGLSARADATASALLATWI